MSLIISDGEPKDIQLNGTAVKEVWFDGKKVWPIFAVIIDEYTVTGTLITKDYWYTTIEECSGECYQDPHGSMSDRNCDCYGREGYELATCYRLELTFSGKIDHLPIKYISKSGATVIIETNKLKHDKDKNTYTHEFDTMDTLEEIQSIYPDTGVTDYSIIKSCDITEQKYEAPELDCDCGEENCEDDCINCVSDDCISDMGDCDCADCSDCDMDCGLD